MLLVVHGLSAHLHTIGLWWVRTYYPGTRPVQHPGYHSLPCLGCLRYSFIDHLERKDEQQGELFNGCPGSDSHCGVQSRYQQLASG